MAAIRAVQSPYVERVGKGFTGFALGVRQADDATRTELEAHRWVAERLWARLEAIDGTDAGQGRLLI